MDINLWEELIKTYGPKLKAVATNVRRSIRQHCRLRGGGGATANGIRRERT